MTGDVDELTAFREEAVERLEVEDAVLAKVRAPRRMRMVSYLVAVVLIALSVAVIALRPNGLPLWILTTYIIAGLAWLLLFLPTSRKEKGFGKQRRAFKKQGLKTSIKTIARRRKRLFAEVWIDTFFYGNVMSTISISLLFGINIVFAAYYGLILGQYDQQVTVILIVQAIAMILLRLLLYVFRPFSHGTLSVPGSFKRKLSSASSRGAIAFVWALTIIIVAIVVIGFVLVLGMLLPGTTMSKILDFLTADGNANLYTVILIFIIQYFVFRHFQSIMSQRLTEEVAQSRKRRLEDEVLGSLASWEGRRTDESGTSAMSLDELRARFYRVAIYKFVKHDFRGFLPIYFLAPDMRYLFNEKVLELLVSAGGLGGRTRLL